MKMSAEIIKSHERLSACGVRFLEFIDRRPDGMSADSYYLLELNDPLFKLQPWPTFIDNQARKKIMDASQSVLNILRSIPARVFDNDPPRMSRHYGINRDLTAYLLYGVTAEHLDRLLARGDFIYSQSGWKCLEYNVNTNLGGMALSFWESLYLATPIVSEFLQQNRVNIKNRDLYEVLFEHLASEVVKCFPAEEELNLAIVMFSGSAVETRMTREKYLNSIYEKVLKSGACGAGPRTGRVFICDYSQMTISGDHVYVEGKKILHLVEWCQGFVPQPILELFKEKKIVIYNGGITWLLSTKLNLALLSENLETGLFDSKEKEIIETYIPWTRKVSPGETTYQGEKIRLADFIRTHREKFVLKPLLGTGGRDIYVGRYTPEEKWDHLVDQALATDNWEELPFTQPMTETRWIEFIKKALQVKSWVVQEYIDSSTYLYQWGENGYEEHHAVWGFFVFGSTYAGAWARVQPLSGQTGVINCHQGAKVSVVFEVD